MCPIRVCFAIPNFDRLGAQRVAVWVAKALPVDRFSVSFLVHELGGEMTSMVPDHIAVHRVDDYCPNLPKGRSITRPLGYWRWLKELRPDVVVGVVQYPTLAIASILPFLRPAPALIACEHSFVSKNIVDPEAYPFLFRRIYRRAFPSVYNHRCAAVIVTAEEGRRDLITNWGIQPTRLKVIPNPLDLKVLRDKAAEPLDDPWLGDAPIRNENPYRIPVIVAAGRLAFQKRFDILVDAFAHARQRVRARLLILGAGEWEDRLRKQVAEHGLTDDVRIENQSPPWRHMARADVFALSSEWEGFPMVLAEAMGLGCPIVSVRCPSGPAEMLDEGQAGWLSPAGDPLALGEGFLAALSDPAEAKRRGELAAKKAEEYSMEKVAARYATLIDSVVKR